MRNNIGTKTPNYCNSNMPPIDSNEISVLGSGSATSGTVSTANMGIIIASGDLRCLFWRVYRLNSIPIKMVQAMGSMLKSVGR